MKSISCLSFVVIFSLASCKSTNSSSAKALLGVNKLEVEKDAKLRGVIGQLTTNLGSCTGFATADEAITTALHCVSDSALADLTSAKFTTADGHIFEIVGINSLLRHKDYLVLDTKQKFSNFLSAGSLADGKVSVSGYDTKMNDLVATQCTVSNRIAGTGIFTHDCDTNPGMSGSPVMQGDVVVGMHLGFLKQFGSNGAYEMDLLSDNSTDEETLQIAKEGFHIGGLSLPNVLPTVPDIVHGAQQATHTVSAGAHQVFSEIHDLGSYAADSEVRTLGAALYSTRAAEMSSANPSWSALTANQKDHLRTLYPRQVYDYTRVHYHASQLNATIGGMGFDAAGQTFCNSAGGADIYLKDGFAEDDCIQTRVLMHELTHVRQCQDRDSSTLRFGSDYFSQLARYGYRHSAMEEEAYDVENSAHSRALAAPCCFWPGESYEKPSGITCGNE